MATEKQAVLLRVFLDETDRFEGRPRYQELVIQAREHGLAGATVLRGPLGYGQHGEIHTAKILRLAEDLPVVVEIVDQESLIRSFLQQHQGLLGSGLVTLERVTVWRPADSPD